jgi:hypothetical protein
MWAVFGGRRVVVMSVSSKSRTRAGREEAQSMGNEIGFGFERTVMEKISVSGVDIVEMKEDNELERMGVIGMEYGLLEGNLERCEIGGKGESRVRSVDFTG